ncbi:hypothetical protein CH63R_07967 [Colletotrichum higginsianum IMI 349063]|uniref:Uncharacterized protein n=1 Tax=Colletotrichum higginsianum (strain IMI 349063) TaxID=759273 RepID=A0A1B7YAV1_COLHI|nr:hypothetical protein CH63R_07967 [Colletotrichum higginsianum IMI 349063]OBR09202.1 hypothetical protein CH63R_07967 [Colletotrichum higginsianum IMI 349063]
MSVSANQADPRERELEHVRIHRQCGACGFLFDVGDRLVAPDRYNLRRLASLPNEVATIIWNFLGHHSLLRFSAVLEAIDYLSTASDEPTSVPIARIEVWHRGSQPITSTVGSNCPIELTIDSKGIARIARLASSVQESWSRFTVYTTVDAGQNLTVDFRFGISRLASPCGPNQLQITDIPNLSKFKWFYFPFQASTTRLASIDLVSCSGITFFLLASDLLAVHAHTQASPSAEVTFARLSPTIRSQVQWFYVPNPTADKISAFGVRLAALPNGRLLLNSRSYCIRTPHRGNIAIGPYNEEDASQEYAVYTPDRSILVYAIPEHGPVVFLGAITEGRKCSGLRPSIPSVSSLPNASYASATLTDVTCIWVFRESQTDFCRGLIVQYANGSEQALGYCRLGYDPTERCADVSQFAFAALECKMENGLSRRIVKVKVSAALRDGGYLGQDWTRCSNGCTLEVWATGTEMVMTV